MADEGQNVSGAEEYVSLFIEIKRPIDPAIEKNVRDAVAKSDGVQRDSLHLSENTITVCYDPTRTSKEELTNRLKQAGVELKTTQTDRAPLL